MPNDPPAQSKHIVITGASSGLGQELAIRYSAPSVRLTLLGRSQSRLESVALKCRSKGAIAEILVADNDNPQQLAAELRTLDDTHPVDILIANAGIGGARSVAQDTGEDADYAIELARINFTGTIATIAPLVPAFIRRKTGHIVIVSSLAAWTPMPLSPAYAASKAGIATYATNLGYMLRSHNICVTTIFPGFVRTPMSRDLGGQQPFAMEAGKAAEIILRAIARRKTKVEFPWQLVWITRLSSLTPRALVTYVQRRSRDKAAK